MHAMTCRRLAYLLIGLSTNALVAAEPVVIASGQGKEAPKQPQAAIGADGMIDLVYGADNLVFHCRSADGGASFGPPKEAFQVANLSLGMRRGPRIVATKDALVVTAIGGPMGMGRDGDLQAWRSTDGGGTWHGPVRVNDSADSAREGLHGMTANEDGTVWCVWLDLRKKHTEVFASKSDDGGSTWQDNVRVYRSPDGNVCECCHPSIAVVNETVHVMFRNSLKGNRDMYIATSKDGGVTFPPAKKIGQGTWKLNACPMDGGMLMVGLKGTVATVWRRKGEIISVVDSGGKEQSLGRGEQPWITSSNTGSVILWTTGREGDLLALATGTKQPKKIAGGARDPMVTSALNGEGPIMACWEAKRDGLSVVLATRLDGRELKSP